MFNVIKDEFEKNSDDILETIHKILAKKEEKKEEKKESK